MERSLPKLQVEETIKEKHVYQSQKTMYIEIPQKYEFKFVVSYVCM